MLPLVVAAALTASCGDPDPGIRGEPIRIGVIVSLTGGLGTIGPHLAKSAQLAAREVNAAGGLLGGRHVELIIVDDQTEPEVAEVVGGQLVEQGVVGVVGSLASGATLLVQEHTSAAQIPQISCCSTSPDLTNVQPENDRYFFRTVPSDLLQAIVVARQAEENSCERLAILHLNDSYGNPFRDAIEANATVPIVARIAFLPGQGDYTPLLNELAAANPDCVALVAFVEEGARILSGWASLPSPPDVRWIGTDGIKSSSLPTLAGSADFVDGVTGTAPIVEPVTPTFNAYAALYETTYSEPVGIYGGSQYDAMALLLLAIEQAGSEDGTAIRDALFEVSRPDGTSDRAFGPGELGLALQRIRNGAAINYEGAAGPVNFDGFGNVISDYEIWRFDAATRSFVRTSTVSASTLQ
ncbi:MAG: ABC transporter substrate-binding protein [Sandaracinus sp.]|nr:ABC transporter substrate-binding protein [Sandaracinus sp.]MCB9635404.1 ABC transporter substrate-binding protein [Sandaracinus sp.]